MNPQEKVELETHLKAIAKILYEDSDSAGLQTLEGIEVTVRQQIQRHVSPELAKTQQRLVHRHDFTALSVDEPLQELAVDGGTVRLRTTLGEICNWRNYKAIVTDQGILADFQNNQGLIDQVNQYPLALPLTCLGMRIQ
jgi:hypothetical protein